jgi:orotidine-5'-phosphate decarboxylase
MTIKLIVALDFDDEAKALDLVSQLDPMQCALKVGSEMYTLFGANFVRALVAKQFKVFLDLKFHDIPNTVARACKAGAELGVWMMNVHASGGLAMMQAAREAVHAYGDNRPLLIAVTILTSMNAQVLPTIGIETLLEQQVCLLAKLAQDAGLDGVVSSAQEVPLIKAACGQSFLTVTPGIRLAGENKHDQSRIITPADALKAGSDYLVIGRPITQAANPTHVVNELLRYVA